MVLRVCLHTSQAVNRLAFDVELRHTATPEAVLHTTPGFPLLPFPQHPGEVRSWYHTRYGKPVPQSRDPQLRMIRLTGESSYANVIPRILQTRAFA